MVRGCYLGPICTRSIGVTRGTGNPGTGAGTENRRCLSMPPSYFAKMFADLEINNMRFDPQHGLL